MKTPRRKALLRSLSVFLATVMVAIPTITALATTNILSANGQVWDVYDNTDWDTGGIDDGSQDAFDNFGMISMYVADGSGGYIDDSADVDGFGLTLDGSGRRFATTTPVTVGEIETSRDLYAPASSNYMRYIDTFTNTAASTRRVWVVWGGNLGSDGDTTVAATSSGDLNITSADSWAVTIEDDNGTYNPAGPATDPPVGYALGFAGNPVFDDVVGYYDGYPYSTWVGNGNDRPGYQYYFELDPGETIKLAYFLYRGLEETNPPPTGSEIALAEATLTAILADPSAYFSDVSAADQQLIANWTSVEPEPDTDPVVAEVAPATGFPQGRVSILPEQPASKAYSSTEMMLNIPKLDLSMPIVGVPVTEGEWDVSWLGDNAGWLNGSAFPTWAGNTVITGHVWDAYNNPGPFAELKTLQYGDQFTINAYGQIYIYEVRESKVYWAGSAISKVFQHEELDWVTLLTCETYNPFNGDYFFRRAVRAVLISIQ